MSLFGNGPRNELDTVFEDFVAARSAALLRTAYLLTGDRGHAEDLLQTTLLRTAWRWQAASAQPEAYARRVLVNLSRDRRRNLGRRVREEAAPAEPPAVGDAVQRIADREALLTALRQLPERQREVVVLRYYADLPVAETALAMGCSEGVVKSHTSRALNRLRALLGAAEDREVHHAE
ncbi:SigE family RNA polymerase sigma factor [Amycolatopsis sp. 195334CR]|uniref:SigE family RNA polymerase sigma factor n=1 Tax=Amycolatopsis sp. 195334CR TaxID=2814588 RepID=UPI0027DE5BA5|nr:SigE family RNA polymerase sigma factor [Amycolatopsis sp. 195334CR]